MPYTELDTERMQLLAVIHADIGVAGTTYRTPYFSMAVHHKLLAVISCGDMVATDAYCADLMKEHDDTFDPEMIALQLAYAEKLGLGTSKKEEIDIIELLT